jgi:hypothetical protein
MRNSFRSSRAGETPNICLPWRLSWPILRPRKTKKRFIATKEKGDHPASLILEA